MMCWYHRWMITRAADLHRVPSSAVLAHLDDCAECRAFHELCAQLPRELATPVSSSIVAAAGASLQQRILAQTTRASVPLPSSVSILQVWEDFITGFSAHWRIPRVALAVVCLLLMLGGGWQYWHVERQQKSLALLQAAHSLYDHAVTDMGDFGWQGLVGQCVMGEYRKLAEDAAATANYFGGLLPFDQQLALSAPASRS